MAVVAQATSGFDHDEVEPERQSRQRAAVGQSTAIDQGECRRSQPGKLPPIDGLFREAVVAARAPADLDDHEGGLCKINADEVELRPPDSHLAAEDAPTCPLEPVAYDRLRNVARQLRSCSHGASIAVAAYAPVTSEPSCASSDQMIASASAIAAAAPGSSVTTP